MDTQTTTLRQQLPAAPRTGTGALGTPSIVGRLWRGRTQDPAWARPALLGLLLATALLYLWGLGASGWANSFYSAAVQAGSESWKAFFFGSSDAANSITVDKTPLALWPMDLSVRIFGLSSWSILVPQALEGVATVALLHHVVRRATGSPAAGLISGAVLALTPVAVLMFRFNNPDAMLVLLLTGAAAATLRAVEASGISTGSTSDTGSTAVGHPVRWLALGGGLVGLAFLAKMLQAFLVLPALALVYVLFAGVPLWRRFGHLLVAFGTMIAAAGWWIAIVELWPASSRPYIGGSQHNSILELTLGYNGFGRLSGDETGSVGGGGAGGGAGGNWGATGIGRLFSSEVGGQIAWLLPAAILLGAAGLWLARRRRTRAALVLWGTWLLVTAGTFSFMAGIFHAYYTVALAPAVAALVGIGAITLWERRTSLHASAVLAFTVALTTVLAYFLLDRTADYVPWLKYVVVVLGLGSALLLAGVRHLPARLGLVVAGVALLSALAAPAAYSLTTAGSPETGAIPSAGPASGAMGGPGGAPGGFGGRTGGPPAGLRGGTGTGTTGQTQAGQAQTQQPGGRTGQTGAGQGSTGGLLNGSTSTASINALLQENASSYRWAAAAIGSNTASGYQLDSQEPVMPIGGFNGSDPSPTLAQFKAYVAAGQIHWFIASGGGGLGAGGSTSSSITSWVEANFTAKTVSGITMYDLSGGTQ